MEGSKRNLLTSVVASRAVSVESVTSNLNVGVVCPMANERDTAVPFASEVLDACAPFGFESVTFYAVLDRVSRDGTLELLRELEKGREEFRVVWAPENRSVVDARRALTLMQDIRDRARLIPLPEDSIS